MVKEGQETNKGADYAGGSPWFLPLVVLLCGLATTAVATYLLHENIQVKNEQRFKEGINHIEELLLSRMQGYLGLLRGGAGLFAANEFVTYPEFRNFYSRLQVDQHYPGMQGFGYSARFPASKLDAVTAMVRAQGFTNFAVWPPEPRDEYHAIVFLEPQDARNQSALGYDMFTEATRRHAMVRARDTGNSSASGKVQLVQEITGPKQNGFLIYLPVYVGGVVPATVEERREKLQGFVYSPFRVGDLLRGIFGQQGPPGIHLQIYDGTEIKPENLLFDSFAQPKDGLKKQSQFQIANRTWTLSYTTTTDFASVPGAQLVYSLPVLGVLASLGLAYFTAAEGRARRRLEISTLQFARQQEWLSVTLASIGDAVITTDHEGKIRFMNSVAERLTGWPLLDAEDRPLSDVFDIVQEETRQILPDPTEQVLKTGKTVNLPNHSMLIARDGTERCVDDSAAPIRGRDGNLYGVVLVFHEITERRQYERRITAQHAVTQVLAESPALDTAAGRLLESICEHLRFDHGVIWIFDEVSGVGEARKIWHLPNLPLGEWDQACLSFRPRKGEGLPGRVWDLRKPLWIADLQNEPGLPRAQAVRSTQLRSTLAFPVATGDQMFGAVELASLHMQKPDPELLHVVTGLGAQIAQFIQRKRAEEALKESEALYRAISETAADGIITINRESVVITMNNSVEQIFGYTREELIGQKLTKIMPPRLHAAHFAGIKRFLATGQKRISWNLVELPGLRKDGTEIPLELSFGVAIRDGKELFTGLIRDISARKEAEKKLQEAEERFGLLVQLADEYAIILKHADGRISHWNPGAERIFGYTAEEVLGKPPDLLFTPEDREQAVPEQEMGKAAAEGTALDDRWYLRKDQSRFWASGSLICLRESDGSVRGFAKILRDMTHRKQSEEAIRELNQDLEERVQRRTAALLESKEQMEAFSYTVAHDLRAPLRAMQGFSHGLIEDYGNQLDQTAQDYLARIMGAAQKMDALIQDLLAFSRLNRSDLEMSRIPVRDAIEGALGVFQHEIAQTEATVAVKVDSLKVLAHSGTLQHALSNLIANALKFTRPGEKPDIRIRAIDHGATVQISVQDNGIGVAAEHHDRIFGVFERLHTQEAYAGTGIGLAIVKKGIERMGGKVGIDSEPGRGSIFWIELPKAN